MTCERAQELITEESERRVATEAELELHLASCDGCASYARELGEAQAWLKSFRREPIDQSVYRELRANVMAEVHRRESSANIREEKWGVLGWRAALACLALSCIILAWAGIHYVRVSMAPLVAPNIKMPEAPQAPDWMKNWSPPLAEPHPGPAPAPWQPGIHQTQLIASTTPVEWPETPLGDFVPGDSLRGFSPARITTRVELATADPSIRIIWLAPEKQ